MGTSTFTAVATNQAGVSSSASISLSFYPPEIGPPPTDNGTEGGTGVFKTLPLPDENGPLGFPEIFSVWTSEQEAVTDEYEYIGEPGEAAVLEVIVFSAEYPEYTSTQSQYDDMATWSIQSSWGPTRNGSHRVNALHEQFDPDSAAIVGLYSIKFPTDPDPEKRKLNLKATVQNIADDILDTAVSFRLLKVDLNIDASEPSTSKLNFSVPENVPISKATLFKGNDDLGWTQLDEKINPDAIDFLIFDQGLIGVLEFDSNNNEIDRDLKLELTIAGTLVEYQINADRVNHQKEATELITGFWIDIGTRIFNHTIRETYYDYVYSIPATGKLRLLFSTSATIDLGSSDFSAGTESHKYNPDGGDAENMNNESSTIGSPNVELWTLQSELWIDVMENTINEGVCTNSGINAFTGTGPALGGSTNNSVDVAID